MFIGNPPSVLRKNKSNSNRVLTTTTTLTGQRARCCYQIGLNKLTGAIYYRDENNIWQLSTSGGGGGGGLTAYSGVVDRGQVTPTKDPVSGQSILQDDSLKGMGNDIQMTIAETIMSSYGDNASFTYDSVTGTIDISPNVFVSGNSVYIDLNQ